MQSSNNRPYLKVGLAAVAAVALVFGLRALNPAASPSDSDSVETANAASPAAGLPTGRTGTSAPGAPRSGEPADKTVFLNESENTPAAPTPTPEPADQGRESRRAYLKTNFTNSPLMSEFKLQGLELTPDGIRLTEGPGEDGVRKGVLESPPLPLEHASNMVAPIWQGTNPDGSSTLVEMQVTQAGKESPWYAVELNDEHISPTYPDGSPNPNYGANVGSPLGFGLELYDRVRYRMTITATGESPVVSGMNVYHADSTDGEGFPASDPPPERAILEAAANTGN